MNYITKKVLQRIDDLEATILSKLKTAKIDSPDSEPTELMTLKEASSFLKLAKSTLYSFSREGRIPAIKKSNRIYFLKTDLMKWLEEGRRKTTIDVHRETKDYLSKTPTPQIK